MSTDTNELELGTLSVQELHDVAVHQAIRQGDADFLWELLRAIPAAAAARGPQERVMVDMISLSDVVSDVLLADEGEIADALRPLYVGYLEAHGVSA